GKTTYAYDAHGRQSTAMDARNGVTTYGYNNADQITSVTTPAPEEGKGTQTTIYYDTSLRAWKMVHPDHTSVTNEYYPTGLLKRTYGSRTYAAGYGYDAQGRMQAMTNWTTFASGVGARVTTWNYDPYRGFLSNKRYPDNTGPDYAYTAAGRLRSRAWARRGSGGQRVLTTYNYNGAGDVYTVTYSNDPAGTA